MYLHVFAFAAVLVAAFVWAIGGGCPGGLPQATGGRELRQELAGHRNPSEINVEMSLGCKEDSW